VVVLVALAFPATFWNAYSGQNGLLTAGLLAWGMLLLKDRPVLAGVTLGLIAYKPQFLPLILLALVAGRHYRAAGAALACAVVLCVGSAALFGLESWSGFFEIARVSSDSIYAGEVPVAKMQSLLAALLLLGASPIVAQMVQAAVAIGCAAFIVWLWRSEAAFEYKAAGLALAVLIASPYSYLYDLTLLGLAALWLGLRFERDGWQAWDAEVILLAWLTPLSYSIFHVSVGPVTLVVMLALLIWRLNGRTRTAEYRELPGVLSPSA
jgi:hypothetical protein